MSGRKDQADRRVRPRRDSGAVQSRSTFAQQLRAWLENHRQGALQSLQRLLRAPLASMLTWLAIGIALALPCVLFVALNNVQQLTAGWDGAARISAFLSDGVSATEGLALAGSYGGRPEIAQARYISREQALDEFRQLSGFGDLLSALPENPLPAVLVLTPSLEASTVESLERLLEELRASGKVELAQLDLQWVQRLYALLELGRRASLALALLLALGVLLVAGNTIRLAIASRREEILVIKLVGGTDAFVRRPFLYTGLWYGLGGAVVAWLLIVLVLLWLDGPVGELAALYQSDFRLAGLSVLDTLALAWGGATLGLCGAWLAVSRHLGAITPR